MHPLTVYDTALLQHREAERRRERARTRRLGRLDRTRRSTARATSRTGSGASPVAPTPAVA